MTVSHFLIIPEMQIQYKKFFLCLNTFAKSTAWLIVKSGISTQSFIDDLHDNYFILAWKKFQNIQLLEGFHLWDVQFTDMVSSFYESLNLTGIGDEEILLIELLCCLVTLIFMGFWFNKAYIFKKILFLFFFFFCLFRCC